MTLFVETFTISVCMVLLSGLPLLSQSLRRYSKFFFLLGTGALAGILVFDLLPDLVEMGGSTSLLGVGAVWLVYSLVHLSHLGHHKDGNSGHHVGSVSLFLASMIAHCVASGVLLVASFGLDSGINRTVFIALVSHKAYEALTVSSILIERQKKKSRALLSIGLYAASLPAGVLVASAFRSSLTETAALLITSLAAGTLLGCLIFDFLLPSLSHLRQRKRDMAWIVVGLILTQVMLKTL